MSELTYLVSHNDTLKWKSETTAYCLHILQDTEPLSPIEDESVVTLAMLGRNTSLGNDPDTKGKEAGEYLRSLCAKHVDPKHAIKLIQENKLNGIEVELEHDDLVTLKDTTTGDVFESVRAESVLYTLDDNLTNMHCVTLLSDYMFITPVWAYEHSGIALAVGDRTYPFNDRWDSYMAGYAFVTKASMGENFPNGETEWQHKALDIIKDVISQYNDYLSGNAYGYVLYKLDANTPVSEDEEPKWEEVDSVWGFIGDDILKSGMAENVDPNCPDFKLTDAIKAGKVKEGVATQVTITTELFGLPE